MMMGGSRSGSAFSGDAANNSTQKSNSNTPRMLKFTASILSISFVMMVFWNSASINNDYDSTDTTLHRQLSSLQQFMDPKSTNLRTGLQQSEDEQHQMIIVTKDEDQPSLQNEVHQETPIGLFYNIYLPPNNPEGIEHSYSIIEEQMEQVGLESGLSGRDGVTLRYVTIGEPFNDEFMNNLCEKYGLNCVHVQHYDEGYEMLTEQKIVDYCNEEENLTHTVSYIHNKGSLHDGGEGQNDFRRVLTKEALSKDCIDLLDSQCNVCGNNFKSVWGPTYVGNMWSGKGNSLKTHAYIDADDKFHFCTFIIINANPLSTPLSCANW